MSTLAEIERAIESLAAPEFAELAAWLEQRKRTVCNWPVPPPDVPLEELERIDAIIEAAFPTSRD